MRLDNTYEKGSFVVPLQENSININRLFSSELVSPLILTVPIGITTG